MSPKLLAALLLPSFVLACSGNAIIEPVEKTSKRAKAFIAKCAAPPPEDGTVVEDVYACLPPEDVCPEASDPKAKEELGFILNEGSGCGASRIVYDVPCGPDLNAVECCYVARMVDTFGGCD